MALAFPSLTATVAPMPSALWSPNFTAPYPTNAPWQNFVLGDGGNPEVVPPYAVKSSDGRIAWGAPPRNAQPNAIIQSFIATLILSTLEGLSTHQVVSYDDTSVTLSYSSSSSSVLSVPLVRGSPYLTFLFAAPGATPLFTTDLAFTAVRASGGGTKHKITLNNGQTWILYSSTPLSLTLDNSTLTATSPFTGTLRAALLPGNSPAEEEALLDLYAGAVVVGGDVKVRPWLLKYKWKTVAWGSDSIAGASINGTSAPLMLALPIHRRMHLKTWSPSTTTPAPTPPPVPPTTPPPPSTSPPSAAPPSAASPSAPSSAPSSAPASTPISAPPPCTPISTLTIPLSTTTLLATPASVATAADITPAFAPTSSPAAAAAPAAAVNPHLLVYLTLDGPAVGVAGNRWEIKVPQLHASFHAPRLSSDPTLRLALRTAVLNDTAALTPITATSTYFFGKAAARAARLALIAEQLGEGGAAQRAVAVVRDALSAWFNGSTAGNALLYDPVWGGIVSQSGAADPGADFGLGCYNDHHFHFGYWLYAVAVAARADPAWAMTHRHAILNLVSDIMSPRATVSFPRLRHFDLYSLHSWASGLFDFADGRNQESFSEAVNGYHAVALLGHAFGDLHLANLGATLAAVEAVAAQTLIQVPESGSGGGVGGVGGGGSSSSPPPPPLSSSSLTPLSPTALVAAATSTSPSYDPIFAAPNRLVGMVWATKRDAGLWFAAAAATDKRVGIQVLPITPFLSRLFPDPSFNRQVLQWVLPVLQGGSGGDGAAGGVTDEWRGFAWALQATFDPAAARVNIEALSAFDDGNSRSNMLWWLAANSP